MSAHNTRLALVPDQKRPDALSSADRIDSWKEIAGYLKRGVRTVQRWEREEELPVHRLQHDKLGSVYAFKSELDAWWSRRGSELGRDTAPETAVAQSVAVLPFADLSRDKDQAYFCEGMAEELIIALSKVAGLHVASRTSSFRFGGSNQDVREIGRQLRVGTLLEGSVRKSDDRLRVSVRLSEGENGYQIWSEVYDCKVGDVFSIQEQISRSVAHALEVTLSPKESAALGKTPTKHVEAYDRYLRGRTFYYRYGPQDMQHAIQLFMQAVEIDPEYPLAYAGLADCWSYIYLNSERSDAVRAQAEWASRRAVALDPEDAQAQASYALALSLFRRDQEAVEAFEKAIRLDPNLFEARYFYARHMFVCGELEKALELYEASVRVRPEDFQAPLLMAQIYDDLGRPEEAKAKRLMGIKLAEERLKFSPDDVRALYMAANGMAALGQRERAREWAGRALALRPDDSMLLYNIGCIYSLLGDVDEALPVLERAVEHGLRHKGWFEHDSNLDPLRGLERFQKIIQSLD